MAAHAIKSAAACCAALLALPPARAGGAPFLRRNFAATRPGWSRAGGGGGAASTRPRTRSVALELLPRGGDGESAVADAPGTPRQQSLDDRVEAAMRRLGLGEESAAGSGPPPPPPPPAAEEGANCEGGVCTLENTDEAATAVVATPSASAAQEDMHAVADRISAEMSVPKAVALAAVYSSSRTREGNRQINEEAARSMVQAEVDAMAVVPEDCPGVTTLTGEGFDKFLVRRSLAFSEMNVENARAILVADREDEEAEKAQAEAAEAEAAEAEAARARAKAEAAKKKEPEMKTVTVDYPKDFDPLAGAAASVVPHKPQQPQKPEGAPPPAKKEDVVFEGTTEELQKLVIESPVPVLLDVYADWCGPCKQLTPALEQICINAGGALRLVKVDTDQQRQISGALGVKSLPTVFGVRDGRILNSFEGLPRDERMVRSFLMGTMVPGQGFDPPVPAEDKERYGDLSNKLLKLAAGASFSFSARERLENHVTRLLDELVASIGGETGMAVADDSARVLRSLMSNIIDDPFEEKYRKIKLDNKVIAAKVAKYPPCLAILKCIGFFKPEGESRMVVAQGERVVNIAPFVVGRGCIDKWIDKNRYQIAAAGRKRRDEAERARLAAEAEEAERNALEEEEESEEGEEEESTACIIKLRLEGKKKVHDIEMDAEDTLSALMERLPFPVEEGEAVQFTCAARRLIVKSTAEAQMAKTLLELRLMPTASIVVKIGEGTKTEVAKGSLAERAASKQKKTTGSHSMHSIGLYAKDDGSKAETFESGGVLYDHVLTDDEDEGGGEGGSEGAEEKEEKGEDTEELLDEGNE